jgi:5-(hydroxymethyl)furfural/furfural oxidase
MCAALIARSGWHALGRRVGSLYFFVNKAYSQGSVTLRSADPADEPLVDFRMLSDRRDLVRLRNAFRFMAEVAASPELDGMRSKIFPTNYSDRVRRVSSPGLRNAVQMSAFAGILETLPMLRSWFIDTLVTSGVTLSDVLADDDTLDAYLNKSVAGVWHPVGSCRMGTDPLAVTTPQGRVHGVAGLRVCDASVMPSIPCANTNITTIMVAERMADFIKGEAQASPHPSP